MPRPVTLELQCGFGVFQRVVDGFNQNGILNARLDVVEGKSVRANESLGRGHGHVRRDTRIFPIRFCNWTLSTTRRN